MSDTMWMVRAGESAYLIDDFEQGYIAIGWNDVGDLSSITSVEQVKTLYEKAYPGEPASKSSNAAAMIFKFRQVLGMGSRVLSYDPGTRTYLVGEVVSDYLFQPDLVRDCLHVRKVRWAAKVSRDALKVSSRNSLGSTLTLFQVNEEIIADIDGAISGRPSHEEAGTGPKEDKEELDQLKEDAVARAHELIKDRILALSPDDMEQLVAALLRAMGYKSKVMPKGPDRGVDVLASPDGLGLESPRIKAEVKHRKNTQMGSQDIRSFLGGLREGDRALYVSTGGFTKDARYEADRSNVPLTLLGLDELTSLIVSHYESFDLEGRVLIPLVRVYWPIE